MKLSEILTRVIAEASAIHALREAEWRKFLGGRESILASEIPVPTAPTPGFQELKDYLTSLPPATVYMMAVIMYVGHGDYDTDDLLGEYEAMSNTFKKPGWAVDQMFRKQVLGQYLSAGLARMAEANIDVDRLL